MSKKHFRQSPTPSRWMHFAKSKKTVAVLAILVVAAAGAIGAYAYFTSTGSGSGTGKVGSASTWTVTGGSETGNLYPLTYPGEAQALTGGSVTNAGSGTQKLQTIVATITGTNKSGCDTSNFEFYSPSSTWALSTAATTKDTATIDPAQSLAPSASYTMTDLSVAMVETGLNQDACQGATVDINYSAS